MDFHTRYCDNYSIVIVAEEHESLTTVLWGVVNGVGGWGGGGGGGVGWGVGGGGGGV